jgi:hypothetical protein
MARKGGTPENLRPAQKGEVRNPTGRPKKLPALDTLLAEIMGEEKEGISAADAILRKLRQMATQGNLRAAEILLDRAYGKAKQPDAKAESVTVNISNYTPPKALSAGDVDDILKIVKIENKGE